MDSAENGDENVPVTPEAAFALLGNETRMGTLQALADAGGPLAFTELRTRVGLRQGAQFNYHLTKLVGHFVEKTEAGYALREPGRRVVQAVRAGAVAEGPRLERTPIDFDCLYCGASVEVAYEGGTFELVCPSCFAGGTGVDEEATGTDRPLASIAFPPAGMAGRTPLEALRAAATWVHLDSVAVSSGVCPRCAAAVDAEVDYCTDHERSPSEYCPQCDYHHAVRVAFRCPNCTFEMYQTGVMGLLSAPELLAFVGDHGFNTTSRGVDWGWDYGEEIRSTDPFEAELTFTIGDETLSVVVDGEMNVVESTRSTMADP